MANSVAEYKSYFQPLYAAAICMPAQLLLVNGCQNTGVSCRFLPIILVFQLFLQPNQAQKILSRCGRNCPLAEAWCVKGISWYSWYCSKKWLILKLHSTYPPEAHIYANKKNIELDWFILKEDIIFSSLTCLSSKVQVTLGSPKMHGIIFKASNVL